MKLFRDSKSDKREPNEARVLSTNDIELVSGGEGTTATPAPPPKTCIQVCEKVENSSAIVCAPVICF